MPETKPAIGHIALEHAATTNPAAHMNGTAAATALDDLCALLAERDALEADVRAMRRSLLIIAQGRTTNAMRVATDALLDHDGRQVKP